MGGTCRRTKKTFGASKTASATIKIAHYPSRWSGKSKSDTVSFLDSLSPRESSCALRIASAVADWRAESRQAQPSCLHRRQRALHAQTIRCAGPRSRCRAAGWHPGRSRRIGVRPRDGRFHRNRCCSSRAGRARWCIAAKIAGRQPRYAPRARVRALWGLSGWRGNERIGKL
jgi:hypothetical protein